MRESYDRLKRRCDYGDKARNNLLSSLTLEQASVSTDEFLIESDSRNNCNSMSQVE